MLNPNSKILVAGHRGLAGSAIVRALRAAGYGNLLLPSRADIDLRSQTATYDYFEANRPEFVFMAAAKVGGIYANSTYPADFIHDNLAIEINIIEAARRAGVGKFLFLGSSCIYPRLATQPIQEESLLTGPLEPTNEWYAIAKIAGIKLCQAYRSQYGFNAISLMPTNLYGPGDNFDPMNSHVLPALIRRFVEAVEKNAPEVVVWGTGSPKREFLHVDDLASAALFLMRNYESPEPINVGTGVDLSIRELAELTSDAAGYRGNLVFDSTKPDGTPRKLLDVSKLAALGWKASIPLEEGIPTTVRWYRENIAQLPQ